MGPTHARLDDRRWHFQHGPMDLVIEAFGDEGARHGAMARGWHRFATVLEELVGELELLRRPVQEASTVTGPVARRMVAACQPHAQVFITPMAAVAGAVADEMIEALAEEPGLRKLYVNNGGDIAIWLAAGERLRVGIVTDADRRIRPDTPMAIDGSFEIAADMPVRGVATSGWRGRSFSLGIADSVTVLAANGAAADAAATVIANAVDIDDPAVVRRPACELKDDTDLGALPVTGKAFQQMRACDPFVGGGEAADGKQKQTRVRDEERASVVGFAKNAVEFFFRRFGLALPRKAKQCAFEAGAGDDGVVGGGLAGHGQIHDAGGLTGTGMDGCFGQKAEQAGFHDLLFDSGVEGQ